MPFLSGMEAARHIRQRDTRVLIVFMSNYAQYAIQGYEVGAWRYLLKPLHWDRFERELRDGSHIPVSKHRRSALMQAFAAYAGDML